MQAERDAAAQKLKAAEPRLQELETQWQTLETTYQEGGIEGLVDLLGGKKGHFTEWRQQELEKEARYLNASAAEKKAMDLEAKLSKMERESAAREARAQEAQKQAGTAQEAAQLKNLESQIVPVFNKHRFAGTLGDPAREAIFDKAVWDQALSNLEALPDSTELTSAIVEKEFKTVATAFRASIGKQANQKAKEVIEKKKQNAQGSLAQAASRSFQKPSTNDQQMRANISKGGIGGLTDALMNVLRTK
jgi:thioesterase domain-containing protein